MHAASRARRLCRILRPPVHLGSAGFIPPNDHQVAECAQICAQACRNRSSSSFSSAARSLGFAGKKALWKHIVYGLTPTIGSANHLLQYAKEHKDATLMQEVMKLLKTNNLPLQPSTADIVFSICYDTIEGCSQSIRRDLLRME